MDQPREKIKIHPDMGAPELKSANPDKELRKLPFNIGEVRLSGTDEEPIIEGYAAVFNSRSEDLGGFQEIILPDAFDDVLGNDVKFKFNHDSNYIIGRTKSGTLTLTQDERGLRAAAPAPPTVWCGDLIVSMRRGDIDQMSFAFGMKVGIDRWYQDSSGITIREIQKVSRLYDVSVVTDPAYPATTVSVRALDMARQLRGTQGGDLDEAARMAAQVSREILRCRLELAAL